MAESLANCSALGGTTGRSREVEGRCSGPAQPLRSAEHGHAPQKRRRDRVHSPECSLDVQSAPIPKRQCLEFPSPMNCSCASDCASFLYCHHSPELPSKAENCICASECSSPPQPSTASDNTSSCPPHSGCFEIPCQPGLPLCRCLPATPSRSLNPHHELVGCPKSLATEPSSGTPTSNSSSRASVVQGHCSSTSAACSCSPGLCAVFGMPTGNLEDRFHVGERVLGSGQFGLVRECFDRFTGERLACKTLSKGVPGDGDVQRRIREIQNEISIMTRLGGHDSLVQLRGVFEDEDVVHLVMDFCEGGDLFDEVFRRKGFEERDAVHLFAEIAKGVAFCHARQVVHRDLKPENLLLTRRLSKDVAVSEEASHGPMIKLADFGLAVALGPDQSARGMAGSPFYMAPEVLAGEYDTKADVWSLGVILHILLTGSPPFYGQKDDDVFQMILQKELDLQAPVWAGISCEVKSLLKSLLQQDPTKRPLAHQILAHPWILRHTGPHHAFAVLCQRIKATLEQISSHVL